MLRTILGISCFIVASACFFVMLYYFLSAIASARQKSKYAKFLGPFIFLDPYFVDPTGRKMYRNAFIFALLAVSFAGLFITIGEMWPR